MKCVMIIDEELPQGLIANTAAVLGLSLGSHVTGLIGPDIPDGYNGIHKGITSIPIPILASTREKIGEIYERVRAENDSGVMAIGFSSVAQSCNKYEDYMKRLQNGGCGRLDYLGVCLYGPEKKVNSISGSIKMLR